MLVRRVLWASVLLGSVLSLVVCYGIATRSLVLGSPEGGWHYGYVRLFTGRPLAVGLFVSVIAGALVYAWRPSSSRGAWSYLLVWTLVGLALQALVRSLTPVTFESIFVSDGANSFYTVTQQHDPREVLSSFNDVRARAPLHAQSNMPGKVMFLYALEMISTRPAVLPWLVLVVSNLGAVLMYAVVRDLFSDRRVALFAAVLYLFVPAKLLFFPLLNTVTPVVVLGCTWLLVRWLHTGRTTYAALLGVAIYGLVFYEPLPLVMGLLFAGLAGRALAQNRIAWKSFLLQIAAGGGAFAATYAAIYLLCGFDLLDAFRQIGAHAVAFNAVSNRPYSIWVRANVGEFLMGMGVCQSVVFCAALLDGLRRAGDWRSRFTQPITTLCVGLLAVLTATDLIGVNRGEVIRLWIFLACFFQIPTAYVCARLESHTAVALVLCATILQAALGTAMIGFIVTG